MFHRLRAQFIITTMSIVSVVLLISFTTIYLSAENTLRPGSRPPVSAPSTIRFERFNSEARAFIDAERQAFAEQSLRELLITLLVAGSVTLVVVYFISRYMADRAVGVIEAAYTKQRQFIADASHELKTPIAVITTNAEAAISDSKKPSKWLSNIKHESERMGRLVNDLLLLAKLDGDTTQVSVAKLDISDVIDEIGNSFELLARKKNVELIRKLERPLEVRSDIDKIRQLLIILVDNAVKYSRPDSKITFSARSSESGIIVDVTNTHKHVTAAELEKFFDRFYQADASHHHEGHGLGLAIARDVAEQLGASLEATSLKNTITFSLVLAGQLAKSKE